MTVPAWLLVGEAHAVTMTDKGLLNGRSTNVKRQQKKKFPMHLSTLGRVAPMAFGTAMKFCKTVETTVKTSVLLIVKIRKKFNALHNG
jgi:hypothetical protein